MNENAQLIAVLAGVVVPILVGVLAKANAGAGLKAVLNAGLSGLAGALAGAVAGDFKSFLIAWGSTWAVSVASYYGLWKPTGAAGAVQGATANVGLGKAA